MADTEALLADLTDEQRDAVTTAADPLCILAGAGSGKTRVLTRRIAWQAAEGRIDPRRVLALTFTRRAASELRARTRRLGLREEVAAATFHGAALAILRDHWDASGRRHPTLLDQRRSLLSKLHPRLDRSAVADLDGEIGWARARLVTPEAYPTAAAEAGRRPAGGVEAVARAYRRYTEAKRERRAVDFDDILALCHTTLRRDASFARAQHWRHRHLFVDEFQDVNPLQFAVLEALRGPDSTLVVVGDPHQAIYGWNGAEPDFLDHIDTHLPGVAVLELRTNFRSTPEILAAAGRVIEAPAQPAARMPGDPPTVTAVDLDGEPTAVALAVRSRHRPGAPWRRQAILARTNAQLPAIAAALVAAGIPVRTRGDAGLLRRPEILDLLDRWPGRSSLAGALIDDDPTRAPEPDPERAAMVGAFCELARDHLALEPDATVDEFVASLRHDDRAGAATDAVELATFHAAKGLEWPIVHLVGMEDGLVPIARARSRAARAEERRLLYVATTRAERELHVTWCRQRRVGQRVVEREPSPWLAAFMGDTTSPRVRPDVRALRTEVGPAAAIELPDTAAAIRRRLAEWREQAARAARVDPGAVLTDAALDRIARTRPITVAELAAVEGVGSGKARRFGPPLLTITAGTD